MFLSNRLPTSAVATLDLCPTTGRARLSYRRAAETFEESTRRLTHPRELAGDLVGLGGWILHQLRHSQLTHEAENGTNPPTLLARSRHASVRKSGALRPSEPRSSRPAHRGQLRFCGCQIRAGSQL